MKSFSVIFIALFLANAVSSFFGETAAIDTAKGLLITGIENGLIKFFDISTDHVNRVNCEHTVSERFTAPRVLMSENPGIPDFIVLDDGTVISNDSEFGEIRIADEIENSFFKNTVKISFIRLPWDIVGEYLEVFSSEYAEFLPAFLVKKGYGIFIDGILEEMAKMSDTGKFQDDSTITGSILKIPLTKKQLSLNLHVSASFPGLPFIPRLRLSRPLEYVNWKINGDDFSPPIDFVPAIPGNYTVTVNATDVFDFGNSASVEVSVKAYEPPVEKKLIFDRCRVGETVLFLGQREGYWQLLDETFHSEKLKWTFEFPGEFDVFFCSEKEYDKYRIIVQ